MEHEPESDQQPHAMPGLILPALVPVTTTAAPFQTTDIALAAFLVCRGHALASLEGPPTLTSFSFHAIDPNEVDLYRLGEPCSAVLFATFMRRLYALVRRRRDENLKMSREAAALSVAPSLKTSAGTVAPAKFTRDTGALSPASRVTPTRPKVPA